ncbi:MAG: helix-turn-helix transcriptional regulator [Planctomycetes bacterium]|nr:helix-turn-helix transcriptional regulator [Planctomycetota bacterium]
MPRRREIKPRRVAETAAAACCPNGGLPPEALNDLAAELDVLFFRALSEPIRLELLRLVMHQGPLDVESAAEAFPQDRSVISRHLAALRAAGLLRSVKLGRRVIYEVNGAAILLRLETLLRRMRAAVEACCPGQLPAGA